MNPPETQTKSSWGGKRKGAGRPKNPDSVRSQFAEAQAGGWHDCYSRYEVWRDGYISEHAHVLVLWLSMWPDKSKRDAGGYFGRRSGCFHAPQPLLSKRQACQIAHFKDKETQLRFLRTYYAETLKKASEQYAGDSGTARDYAAMCKRMLTWPEGLH